MNKIILANGTELPIVSVISKGTYPTEKLEITFAESEDINKIISIYDVNGEQYNYDALTSFSIYSGEEIQGKHDGYSKMISVSFDGLTVSVTLERKAEVEIKLDNSLDEQKTLANRVLELESILFDII